MNKEFISILKVFIPDVKKEFTDLVVNENINKILNGTNTPEEYTQIYEHSKNAFSDIFSEILNKNDDIFKEKDKSEFIKDIYFSDLWENANEKTQNILWKYLQLFLFAIVYDLDDKESFEDEIPKLLKSIQENILKEKLQTLSGETFKAPEINDELKSQMDSILNGKIGSFAKEIAKDTMKELNIDESSENQEEIFKKMMQNPSKLLDLTKDIGNKLERKIKSGEMNEKELMKEATQMMDKMKHLNIPGVTDIFKNMSKNMNSEGMKRSMNSRERLRKKLEERKSQNQKLSGDGVNQVYTIDNDSQKKTARKI